MTDSKSELRYPRLYRRIQAAIIDSIILTAVFFITASTVTPLEIHGALKAAIVVVLIFILEPGLVSTKGGTIGHQLLGLRIQNKETGGKLNILFALIRFIFKSILGLPSFIFVLVTRRHQAIHDFVSSSVVVIKNPTGAHEFAEQKEREVYHQKYEYPAWYLRITIIFIYGLIAYLLLSAIAQVLVSDDCIFNDRCSSLVYVYLSVIGLIWIATTAVILVYGWTGRLYGARRKARNPSTGQSED